MGGETKAGGEMEGQKEKLMYIVNVVYMDTVYHLGPYDLSIVRV